MPDSPIQEDPIARAENARDLIQKELTRLQAQFKGIETKIIAMEAKLQGANEIVEAMKPKKGNL